MTSLAVALVGPFSPLHFLVGFLVLVCVMAIIIIAVKWLLALSGVPIPQPLLMILGILVFIILLFVLLNYSGLYSF